MNEIRQITEKIKKFRDDRDWMQFHDSKNMAVSIMLEASELLEHFQWKTTEEVEKYAKQNHVEIKDEIADIALYLFELADNLGINLIDAIEKSKTPTLPRLIYALGIRQVGEHMAHVLAEEFSSLESLIGADKDRLLSVRDIGPETAESIFDFFQESHNIKVIEKLKKAGVVFSQMKKVSGKLFGKTFLFTGALSSFARDEAKDLVEKQGGKTVSSISKNIDYVVAGAEPGSKYDEAKRLGLKIITEEEFKKYVR